MSTSAATLGASLSAEATFAAMPPRLLESTIRAATSLAAGNALAGTASAGAVSLTEGVLRTMLMTKLKAITAASILVGFSIGGAGVLARVSGEAAPQSAQSSQEGSDLLRKQLSESQKEAEGLRRRQKELVDRVQALMGQIKSLSEARNGPIAVAVAGTPGVRGMQPVGMPSRGMAGMAGLNLPKFSIPTLETAKIIAVYPPGGEKIWAQSADHGVWKVYQAPEGSKLLPMTAVNLLGVEIRAPVIRQVTVFDAESGEWMSQDLKEPAEEKVSPFIGPAIVYYPIGRYIYAYSSLARRWDVLELAEGAKPLTGFPSPSYLKFEDGSRLHIFNAKTGRWSTLDTHSEK